VLSISIKQNESTASRRRVPVYLVDATDGFTPETGVTSPSISVSKNGGTQASGTGTWTEVGNGMYYYETVAGEVDTVGWLNVRVLKSTVSRETQAICPIVAGDPNDARITIRKNTALTNFAFKMVSSANHYQGKTGLTSFTAQRSIDGGAFGALTNAVTEIGNGMYKIDLAAADLNGDVVALRFTASGADERNLTILTQP
jgi:hypothetical protein